MVVCCEDNTEKKKISKIVGSIQMIQIVTAPVSPDDGPTSENQRNREEDKKCCKICIMKNC